MSLRNNAAALALACAAGGGATATAPVAALAQDGPRPVQVTPGPPHPAPQPSPSPNPDARPDPRAATPPGQPDERQRAIELYRAHFGGQLTKAPYLGVSTSTVPAALRQHLGLAEGVGLVVEFVEPESPAQAAGLKQYDIIKKLDEQILVNAQQLAVLVRSRKAGDEVKLSLIRGGKEQLLSAKLVEKEVKPLGDLDLFEGWGTFDGAEPGGRRPPPRELRGRTANVPRAPAAPGATVPGERTMSVWRDNDMTLTLSKRPGEGGRHLVVTEKSGKVVFDGNLDDAKKRSELPPHVAEKVRQMESKLPPNGREGTGADVRFEFKTAGEVVARDEEQDQRSSDYDRGRPEGGKGNKNDNDSENDNDEDDDDRGASSKAPIGANDLLHIAIAHVHGPGVETVKTTRVRDGRVRLPYVAPIPCEGLTAVQLEKQIASAYADAKVSPNVSVRVRKLPQENPEPRKQ